MLVELVFTGNSAIENVFIIIVIIVIIIIIIIIIAFSVLAVPGGAYSNRILHQGNTLMSLDHDERSLLFVQLMHYFDMLKSDTNFRYLQIRSLKFFLLEGRLHLAVLHQPKLHYITS